MRAEQEQLAVLIDYVGFFDLHAAFAQAFDFPALKRDTRIKLLHDEIIMGGFFVACNGRGIRFGFFLFGHGWSIFQSIRRVWL